MNICVELSMADWLCGGLHVWSLGFFFFLCLLGWEFNRCLIRCAEISQRCVGVSLVFYWVWLDVGCSMGGRGPYVVLARYLSSQHHSSSPHHITPHFILPLPTAKHNTDTKDDNSTQTEQVERLNPLAPETHPSIHSLKNPGISSAQVLELVACLAFPQEITPSYPVSSHLIPIP